MKYSEQYFEKLSIMRHREALMYMLDCGWEKVLEKYSGAENEHIIIQVSYLYLCPSKEKAEELINGTELIGEGLSDNWKYSFSIAERKNIVAHQEDEGSYIVEGKTHLIKIDTLENNESPAELVKILETKGLIFDCTLEIFDLYPVDINSGIADDYSGTVVLLESGN